MLPYLIYNLVKFVWKIFTHYSKFGNVIRKNQTKHRNYAVMRGGQDEGHLVGAYTVPDVSNVPDEIASNT